MKVIYQLIGILLIVLGTLGFLGAFMMGGPYHFTAQYIAFAILAILLVGGIVILMKSRNK